MDKSFEALRDKGVSFGPAVKFMPYVEDSKGNILRVDYLKASKTLASDAAMATAPNIGIPAVYSTYIDPQVVPILFAVQNASKVFSEIRKGDWTDKNFIFPVEEFAGNVTPYSDFTENVTSDVNYEYPERQNFLFETTIKYGDLEEGVAARAKINLVSSKQRSAAFIIANAHNRFFLYGVAGKRVYGLLNDPNLEASETPNSINGNSTWEAKTAADPSNAANIVYSDINKLWASLTARNGGNVDANSRIVLAVSNAVMSYLTMPNTFGLTALKMLKDNFPNIEVVELPELSTNAGEMVLMTVPELFGVPTGFNAYSEKFRMGRIVPELSSFKQKLVGGTWGSVITRPSLVATMIGV